MNLTFSSPPATRLCQLLVLLLLALGLLAGVSVSQTRVVEARAVHTQVVVVPALQSVHALASRVDEQRGMAALHITLRDDVERQALETRLEASRQQLERRMVAVGQRLAGDTDRQHHAAVQAGLASFWDAQDRLLAASRRAVQDPAAAELARALLVGEAQRAFEHVRAAIEAWWVDTEREAALAASEASAASNHAALMVWAQALLAVLALAVGWAMLRLPLQPLLPPPPGTLALDGAVAHQHLMALNDAVATARRGEPGRAAGLSALEAQRLAEQVDSAAQALRRLIDRPTAASAADKPDSAMPPR